MFNTTGEHKLNKLDWGKCIGQSWKVKFSKLSKCIIVLTLGRDIFSWEVNTTQLSAFSIPPRPIPPLFCSRASKFHIATSSLTFFRSTGSALALVFTTKNNHHTVYTAKQSHKRKQSNTLTWPDAIWQDLTKPDTIWPHLTRLGKILQLHNCIMQLFCSAKELSLCNSVDSPVHFHRLL